MMTLNQPNQHQNPPEQQVPPTAHDNNEQETPSENPSLGHVGFFSRINKRLLFFGVVVILALVLFFVAYLDSFTGFAKTVSSIISPLIIGCVIAYLCDPILEFYEYRVFKKMKKGNGRRGLSLALTVLTAFAIVALIALMMIPELVASVKKFIAESDNYINEFLGFTQGILNWFNENFKTNLQVGSMEEGMTNIFGMIESWVSDMTQGDNLAELGGDVWAILLAVFNAFKNLIIGLFIAFYILGSKEKRVAQINKFRAAVLTEKQDQKLGEFIKLTDHCFGGFIFGKILDSLVIGILTFILMTIFKVSEYNLLIATFVGLTNVIPVFGPFIGAIPSAFIVLISNPSKALLFILLILIIQQLDGNIIGPKILGDNTGVSSLCVIIAITVCGSIWGIPGMIVGVPLFAVVIEWIKRILELRLTQKGKETDTLAYYPQDAVGNAEQDLYYEHAGLLYQYEHSGLKPKFERMKNKMFSKMGRQAKKKDKKKDKKK